MQLQGNEELLAEGSYRDDSCCNAIVFNHMQWPQLWLLYCACIHALPLCIVNIHDCTNLVASYICANSNNNIIMWLMEQIEADTMEIIMS